MKVCKAEESRDRESFFADQWSKHRAVELFHTVLEGPKLLCRKFSTSHT